MEHPLVRDLLKLASHQQGKLLSRFFKTGKGEYGEGDVFIGVMVPQTRSVAKKYRNLPLQEIDTLVRDKRHEVRLCVLLVLVDAFERGDSVTRRKIYDFYLDHLKWVNNWDLVDVTSHKIVGEYLADKNRSILRKMARSEHLWTERVAIIATAAFIKRGQLDDTFAIAEILLQHPHDLLHKAVGWMLREVGKKDVEALKRFLDEHGKEMPRTMLRYAIEKFPERERKHYLSKAW